MFSRRSILGNKEKKQTHNHPINKWSFLSVNIYLVLFHNIYVQSDSCRVYKITLTGRKKKTLKLYWCSSGKMEAVKWADTIASHTNLNNVKVREEGQLIWNKKGTVNHAKNMLLTSPQKERSFNPYSTTENLLQWVGRLPTHFVYGFYFRFWQST